MKLKKVICIVIIPLLLTGCWNSHEINNLVITICIGLDKTENGYMVTTQVLNSKSIAAKVAVNESPIVIYSETGKDILENLRRMTTETRKIYNSHLRMVVIGEELATEGIQDILDFFMRDHEFRTDFYIVVAKGTTAKKVLTTLTPLEIIPGLKLYNSLKNSESAWAPTKAVRIIELVNSIISDGKNPVLTGVEIIDGSNNSDSVDLLKESDAGNRLKYTSLGAFKKDKLVGWLNEPESKGYNYIIGNIKSTVGYTMIDSKQKVTFEVTKEKSKIKAYLLNGKPAIKVEINYEGNIAAVEGQIDITKEENETKITKMLEKKTKSMCDEVLEKTKTDFHTDIFGFGEVIHRKYPKQWAKIKDNWNDEFVNLPVDITINVKINRFGQNTKSFFIKEEE